MLSPTSAKWVFFLSGAAALLYQIVWQRLLVFFSGSDIYSSTLVVAAFMAGLGVGHLCGGQIADRLSRRANLLMFAAAELAIAAFSVLSRPLYYDLLYQRLGSLSLPPAVIAALLFASLLWPTFFMGVSLPVLARAFTDRLDRAASSIGMLYGLNALGAAAGAFITTWFLLPRFGLDRSLWIGGLINLTCAIVVLAATRRRVQPAPESADAHSAPLVDPATEERLSRPGFLVWCLVFGLSGFLALSLEIVWFRLLGVMVKSTAFTFGTLLAVYLAGLGAGSLVGTRYAGHVPRPATAFLAIQAAIGLTAGALFTGFVELVADVGWFTEYFSSYEPLDVMQNVRRLRLRDVVTGVVFTAPDRSLPWEAVLLYLVVPACLITLPTFLMGFAFPVLQRVVQTDFDRLGRRVGFLLLANVVGSVAGTLLTGWVALNVLGTAGTMRTLMIVSGIFALLALWTLAQVSSSSAGVPRMLRTVGVAAVLLVVALTARLMPSAEALWARLHGATVNRVIFGEDATGLSVLRVDPAQVMVFVNGLGQSAIPYGDVHTALGMLPAFIHPAPRKVAIIGLGSGDTVYAAAGRQEIEEITSIEIIRPQLETLRRFDQRTTYAGLRALLNDSRIRHVPGDGRITLMRSAERFDIIEADALRPNSAYSGNLFSDGYFRLLRDRLRPNGLAVTWSPTVRIHNAFVRVFPYVVALPGMLLGSTEPIVLDPKAVVERLGDPVVREHYTRAGIDLDRIVTSYLVELGRFTPAFNRAALVDFNTDLFPKDEFDRPAAPWDPATAPEP